MIDKDIEIVKQDLNNWKKEFGTEGSVAINIKSLENVLKELDKKDGEIALLNLAKISLETQKEDLKAGLDTYKKVAEKLAEDKIIPKCKNCSDEDTHECTECALEWAIKEVEKDVVKEYIYLVSYHHSTGYGTITIHMNGKINSIEHITEIHKYIEDKNNFEKVGIISYQLICEKWARKEVE